MHFARRAPVIVQIPPGDWFTLDQVGAIFGRTKLWASKAYDECRISGHSHGNIRKTRRIPRAWIIVCAATCHDFELVDPIGELARAANSLPPSLRREVAARIQGGLPIPQKPQICHW